MEKFVRISFLLALGGAAMAADLTGTWTGHVPARNGQTDVVFQFQQNGATLTGKLYGDTGDLKISDGTVSGDTFRFSIRTEGYSGKTNFIYEGSLKDGEMHLTREREDSETRANAESKKKSRQEIVLKKMT